MPEQKKAVVPRLRFPEFRDAGPWEVKRLGGMLAQPPEYGVNAPAVPFSTDLPTYLRITDITETGQLNKENLASVDINAQDAHYLSEGDIVLARTGASVGKSYKYRPEDGKLVFAGYLIRVRPKQQRLNSGFLAHYLLTGPYWRWVETVSARSGQPGVNGTQFAQMPVPLPGLSEQQKIADCLSSLDELIELEAKKLEALQAHKKGLMQQLFPREGETTPRLRFPEFRDAGPWEVKRLGEIVEIINERAGDKKCTLLSVTAGIGLVSQVEKFGCEIAGKQRRNYFILRKNDFAYNKSSTKDYPEGYIGLYEGDEIAAVPNSIFVCFRPAQEKVVPRYLRFLFEINVHGRWMRRFITVGARAHGSLNIDNHDLLHIPIPLPATAVSIPEQQKIADCLSSLDELIELQAKQLEALKAHKKGLMQQLFPQEIDP